jgi:hypothetical protein
MRFYKVVKSGSARTESSSSRAGLVHITDAVEFIAKYGAAIGMTALATAFLYDSIFWWIVDSRVLGYFVAGDHVQTAVRIISVLVIAMVFCAISVFIISLVGTRLIRFTTAHKKVATYAGIGMALIGVVGSLAVASFIASSVEETRANLLNIIIKSSPDHEQLIRDPNSFDSLHVVASKILKDNPESVPKDLRDKMPKSGDFGNAHFLSKWLVYLGGFFLVVVVVVGMAASRKERIWQAVEAHPLRYVLVGWIALTGYLALTESILIRQGVFIRASAGTDIINLKPDSSRQLNAILVRIIDKGVILRDFTDGRVMFLPMDQIQRIDQDVIKAQREATPAAPTP